MRGSEDTVAVRSLSIAAPAYNEAEGLERIVRGWVEFLKGCSFLTEFEIVVCNDGSLDQTGAILDRIAAEETCVRALHHPVNEGAAAALATAIRATRLEWVGLLDSDGQFPVTNLLAMVDAAQQHGASAVIGVRAKKDSAFARFGSWSSGLLCNLFHGTSLRDFNSALKLVRGPLLRGLAYEAKGLNYSTEVTSRLLEAGIVPVEVEIEHVARNVGRTSRRALRDAAHRLAYVVYVGMRQLLLRIGVLQRKKIR